MITNGWIPRAALATTLLLSASTLTSGQDQEGGAGGPVIRFDEQTHDFGEFASDENVTYRWLFHNDGDEPLQILRTRPSCGCTATVVKDDVVAPGGTGALEVTLDGAGLGGPVRKTLAVVSNDPRRPNILLTIKANVKPAPVATASGDHPPIAGQSMLTGGCASCHARPADGKYGEELYAVVCAMCHGPKAEGGRAPGLRSPDYLASHSDEDLEVGIAYGTANPKMPGFVELMGGPLSESQIRSIVRLIREWGPLSANPDAAR